MAHRCVGRYGEERDGENNDDRDNDDDDDDDDERREKGRVVARKSRELGGGLQIIHE